MATTNGSPIRSKSPTKGHASEQASKGRKQNLKTIESETSKGDLLAELIWWETPKQSTHAEIVQALTDAGLDPEIARAFNSEKAAGRALKALEEDRDIAIISRDKDEVMFQFTRREKIVSEDDESSSEYKYSKECKLRLTKATGTVSCKKIPALAADVQAKLNAAMELRTRSDMTEIIKKVFQNHKALLPYIGNGSVYIVALEHQSFANQIAAFLTKIGGELFRSPIPKGSKEGTRAVQKTFVEAIRSKVQEHREHVEKFNLNSAPGTMENFAEKFKESRLQLEAYKHYLAGEGTDIEDALNECDSMLVDKIKASTEHRESLPKSEGPAGKDEWGSREGSGRARMNAAFTKTPKTLEEICTEAGLATPKHNHLKALLAAKLVLKAPDGKFLRNPHPPVTAVVEDEE